MNPSRAESQYNGVESRVKLAFVCNQNQARSQVLSSIFTTMLPTWEVASFGLIARESTPLPMVVESVFYDWGLDPSNRFAKNMGLHWNEMRDMQIIIAVTSFIAEEVKSAGYHGEILDLEREASRIGIALVDPQLMPRRECAFELAKYVKVATSALQGIGLIRRGPKILALLPESESAINKAVEIALKKDPNRSSVIIGDLIAPRSTQSTLAAQEISHFRVDEKSSSITIQLTLNGGRIYIPYSASMCPSRVYLSKSWQDFILKMPRELLTIITPPLKNATGKIADSYLASLYADESKVVQY
jgi:protein-tyrosine-phosphatase